MTNKARLFLDANRRFAVEYFSADAGGATFRLTDQSRWELTRRQLGDLERVRFAGLEAA